MSCLMLDQIFESNHFPEALSLSEVDRKKIKAMIDKEERGTSHTG